MRRGPSPAGSPAPSRCRGFGPFRVHARSSSGPPGHPSMEACRQAYMQADWLAWTHASVHEGGHAGPHPRSPPPRRHRCTGGRPPCERAAKAGTRQASSDSQDWDSNSKRRCASSGAESPKPCGGGLPAAAVIRRRRSTSPALRKGREGEAFRGPEASGRRDSNPRHSAWEADALPTELRPQLGGEV